MLMQHCAQELKARGFERVYSRIWWNHHSSIRLAEKAGRTHIATIVELRFFGAKRPLRFVKRVNYRITDDESCLARPHGSQ